MPTTESKENVGRLRSFKNKGKDNDVRGYSCHMTVM